MLQTVAKLRPLGRIALVVMAGIVSGLPPNPAGAEVPVVHLRATGYVCIHHGHGLLVDVERMPPCATSSGVPLGPITGLATRAQGGAWRVTSGPRLIRATIRTSGLSVTSVSATIPRRDRFAEAMSTVEVARFDPAGASDRVRTRTRDQVFAALPEIAAIAGGATVRTARRFIDGDFHFGAQVRDAAITHGQIDELRAWSARTGIPVAVVSTPARRLQSCSGPTAGGQPTGAGLVSAARFAAGVDDTWSAPPAPTPPSTCDELTQVRIVSAPIIATPSLDDGTDTVIDASVRVG